MEGNPPMFAMDSLVNQAALFRTCYLPRRRGLRRVTVRG